MPMPRLAGSDHRPLQNVECGEQCGGSVSLIIVGLPCWQAGAQRKNRLRAVQRLNLAFFIYAKEDRLIWWVHIEPHNVAHFPSKFRIITELEGLHSIGLQFVLLPNPLHGSRADFLVHRHGPDTPMSGILRGGLDRRLHNGVFPLCGDLLGASATRPVLQYCGQVAAFKSPPPQQYSGKRGRQVTGQNVIEAVNGNIKALLPRGSGYRDMNYLLLKAQRLAVSKTEFLV